MLMKCLALYKKNLTWKDLRLESKILKFGVFLYLPLKNDGKYVGSVIRYITILKIHLGAQLYIHVELLDEF